MADTRTDDQKAKDAMAVKEILAQIRRPYEPMIDDILTYIQHSRRRIMEGQKGEKTGSDVYDGTALGALNLLSDGLFGYLVAPSLRWFGLTLPGKLIFPRSSGMRAWSGKKMDEYPEVKQWLEDCEEVLYAAFLRSNFYDSMPEFLRDGTGPGTATLLAEEDLKKDRIVFAVPHFRECYIAENRFGLVDTNYRIFKMTLRQLVDKFGLEKMDEADRGFKKRYEKDKHQELEVLHAVYPREDYDPGKLNGINKPVASLWVLVTKTKLLMESGYEEGPAITWRWRKNSDEVYGRSPAWDAFVDVMTANQEAKTNLIAAHKMVEPPMIGPEDLRGKIHDGPKGWTWVDQRQLEKGVVPKPLLENVQLPFGIEQMDRLDKRIKENFHVDFFLMLYQTAFNKIQITATQVLEMQGEKAAILGTRIGSLQTEALNPIIDRVFSIERRAGRIPDPPEILMQYGGRSIEVDYLGPLAQAQKRLFKAQGIAAGIEALTPLARIFPESLDVVDADETARELLEARGFPSKTLRSEEEIAQIRGQRAKQQQAASAMAGASQMAKALPAAGKAAEPGSPLDALMNAASQTGQPGNQGAPTPAQVPNQGNP